MFALVALTGYSVQLTAQDAVKYDYRLLATTRTSTMEKELNQAGGAGYEFLDVMVGNTAFGGKEVISILRKYEN